MVDKLPISAAWQHRAARNGFEVVFPRSSRHGWLFDGHCSAVEDGRPWAVRYRIAVDRRWRSRRAEVWSWSEAGELHRTLQGTGAGRWEVDGAHVPALDGCLDVDLEASACTNTFPIHRFGPTERRTQEAPAVYVRVSELAVERLEQRYTYREDGTYDYEAPGFEFTCRLRYDEFGLVVDYPGIATRAG